MTARLLVAAALLSLGCAKKDKELAASAAGGDRESGRALLSKYGCGTCHTIPGVTGAKGNVGPSLDGVGKRAYVAGEPNSLETMTKWVKHPQKTEPGTPMPEQNMSEQDAKDIAAYLFGLR
jgi:cytochrome c